MDKGRPTITIRADQFGVKNVRLKFRDSQRNRAFSLFRMVLPHIETLDVNLSRNFPDHNNCWGQET